MPTAYETIVDLVTRASEMKSESMDDIFDGMFEQREKMTIENGVAKIHVFGTLLQKASKLEKTCGNTDYADIKNDVDAAVAMGAQAIFLHIDSPGGIAAGMKPCAMHIRNCGIPSLAYIDGTGCSAAYGLACGATMGIVCSPESKVGNIGTILPWVDKSKIYETMGLNPDPITNAGADLKSIGYTGSLTESQRAYLQAMADEHGAKFHALVKMSRDEEILDPEVWRGGWYSAETAAKLGLVDEVGTVEQTMQMLKI